MPFVVLEDVGTTQRRSLSGLRRLQAWERTAGTCVICGQRIDGVRERWIIEHIRALELGGADDLENMGPAHETCGREKTRDDHTRTARAKRQKIRHLGAAIVARPLPGSRAGALKRKINGLVVPRGAPLDDRAEPQHEAEQDRSKTEDDSSSLSTDACRDPADGLCNHPTRPARMNTAGTEDLMANRTTTASLGRVPDAHEDVAAPGEILAAIPAHLDFLFADRPLMPGESAEQYDALLRSMVQQVKPADVIEAIWVKDVSDFVWEAKRLRRWRGQILVQARKKAAEELMNQCLRDVSDQELSRFIEACADRPAAVDVCGSESETAKINGLLQERGYTEENIMAHGFLLNLLAIERIDRLASAADQRRDALLREIERKRASFAQQVRIATADVLDVEHTETR